MHPPDSAFSLSSTGKADINATVDQAKTEFTYADGVRIGTSVVATGTVTASGMTAGEWHGQYQFDVSLDGEEPEEDSMCLFLYSSTARGSTLFNAIVPEANEHYDFDITDISVDGQSVTHISDGADEEENMMTLIQTKDGYASGDSTIMLCIPKPEDDSVIEISGRLVGTEGYTELDGQTFTYSFSLGNMNVASATEMTGAPNEYTYSNAEFYGESNMLYALHSSTLDMMFEG